MPRVSDFEAAEALSARLLSKVCEAGETEDGNRKWNLIILEDAGEFIAMDSRFGGRGAL